MKKYFIDFKVHDTNSDGIGYGYYYEDEACPNIIIHNENGPALKYDDGREEYLIDGKHHREDGPAIKNLTYEAWYQNSFLHRLDGPAMEYKDGSKFWYYFGKQIFCSSQEEFEKLIKLKAFW